MKKIFILVICFIVFIFFIIPENFSGLLSKAKKGDEIAQYKVGEKFLKADGVERDFVKGYNWIEKSAKQGYPQAQFQMGVMYNTGIPRGRDQQKALMWYEKSADSGYPEAQANLGYMYFHGTGIEKNNDKCKYWLNRLRKNPKATESMKDSARIFLDVNNLE